MFKQLIKDGYQAEVPDIWLEEGNPWEVKRHDIKFEVGFSGKTVTDKGKTTWIPGEKVRHKLASQGTAGCGSVRQALTVGVLGYVQAAREAVEQCTWRLNPQLSRLAAGG